MGWLSRRRRRAADRRLVPAALAATVVKATLFDGNETLEVVGESRYQDELWALVGGHTEERVSQRIIAFLLPNPAHPVDEHAIEVRIEGALVGYISREDAEAYQPGVLRLMEAHPDAPIVALHGVIVGGGWRGGRIGFLGVFLDHDPADFGLPSHHVSQGEIRTGRAAEADSDPVVMSWLRHLPDDDQAAVGQLRELLSTATLPLQRHFMFNELERRLYRRRDMDPSAMDEFDATCAQHHQEMGEIRAVLVERFGGVPMLLTYRQAAIRCQKARRWEDAGARAQRGIDLYGGQPLRPEALDDLRHRVEYVTAKLATAPRQRQRSAITVPANGLRTETLTCLECGESFERLIMRGRKPMRCPHCAGRDPVLIA
jgi:hypothetical protein